MLRYYLYRSQCAISPFDIRDVDILRTALSSNPVFGVTGFLYKSRTHFFQYFEARSEVADQLFANLHKDRRHFNIQILLTGEIAFPKFSGWSMGYADHSEADPLNRIELDDPPTTILEKLERKSQVHLAKLSKLSIRDRDQALGKRAKVSASSSAYASSKSMIV